MEHWRKHVFVLTGSVGSGKSTVAGFLAEFGAVIVCADRLAKEVVEVGSKGLDIVVDSFGSSVLRSDGSLNRELLGNIIFLDNNKRLLLESILHPLIRARADELLKDSITNPTISKHLTIYDCPLYFETYLAPFHETMFGPVILVYAPAKVCIERVIARNGLTKAQAQARLAAQINPEEKRKLADIIIENTGSLVELREKTRGLFEQLRTGIAK